MPDELIDAGGGGGEGGELGGQPTADAGAPTEPFLKVNERTSYKTSEDAVQGYSRLQDRVIAYSKYGEPGEIEARLRRLDAIEAAAGNGKPRTLTPEQKAQEDQWDQWKAGARERGFVTKEDLDEAQAKLENDHRRQDGLRAFRSLLTEHKIDLDEHELPALEDYAVAIMSRIPAINYKYFHGDVEGAIKDIFDRRFGEVVKARQEAAGSQARTDQQKARDAAADLQATKAKTAKLPSAPPKAGAPPVKAPEGPNYGTDSAARRARAREILDERTGAGL